MCDYKGVVVTYIIIVCYEKKIKKILPLLMEQYEFVEKRRERATAAPRLRCGRSGVSEGKGEIKLRKIILL